MEARSVPSGTPWRKDGAGRINDPSAATPSRRCCEAMEAVPGREMELGLLLRAPKVEAAGAAELGRAVAAAAAAAAETACCALCDREVEDAGRRDDAEPKRCCGGKGATVATAVIEWCSKDAPMAAFGAKSAGSSCATLKLWGVTFRCVCAAGFGAAMAK